MQTAEGNLLTRDDTFFGICEGLGEDLGIHPNLLRLGLTLMLFWNPYVVMITYAAAGLIVAFTRWLFPNPKPAVTAPAQAAAAEPQVLAANEPERELLAA